VVSNLPRQGTTSNAAKQKEVVFLRDSEKLVETQKRSRDLCWQIPSLRWRVECRGIDEEKATLFKSSGS